MAANSGYQRCCDTSSAAAKISPSASCRPCKAQPTRISIELYDSVATPPCVSFRESAAEAMGGVVQEHARRFAAAQRPLFPSVADAARFAPTSCTECVLRLSFQMLTACLHRHHAFHRWLIEWCAPFPLPPSPPPPNGPLWSCCTAHRTSQTCARSTWAGSQGHITITLTQNPDVRQHD